MGEFQPVTPNGQVAQLVERSPEKAGVGGSIPSLATTLTDSTFSTYSSVLPPVPDLCHGLSGSEHLAGSGIPGSIWHSSCRLWRGCPPGWLQLPREFHLSLRALMLAC